MKTMEKKIHFQALMEVLGKPKEHVDLSMKQFIDKLKEDKKYEIIKTESADIKKQDDSELWSTFTEIEAKAKTVSDLIGFCFDYMPSVIEITQPKELVFKDVDVAMFLNDLQARLHQVDMLAKSMKLERDRSHKSMGHLLRNYITLLLRQQSLSSDQLSQLTGVSKEKLEDFLDQLIDKGKIDLKEGKYHLKNGSE